MDGRHSTRKKRYPNLTAAPLRADEELGQGADLSTVYRTRGVAVACLESAWRVVESLSFEWGHMSVRRTLALTVHFEWFTHAYI